MTRSAALLLDESAQYRDKGRLWAALALCSSAALLLTVIWKPTPLLVWNESSSVPQGLYVVHAGKAPKRGQIIVAWLSPSARRFAAARDYLPWTVPLVKPVAALTGDRVCASGHGIVINGRLAAIRTDSDSRGRALPHWNGCVLLGRDQFFLLSSAPGSFDGRYFGIVGSRQIIGRAEHR